MQQLLNRGLGMGRVSALKDFAELGLHFVRGGAMLTPALAPCRQQQRLAGIRVMIARDDQRCPRFQVRPNRSQLMPSAKNSRSNLR